MPEKRINRVVLFPEKAYARRPEALGLSWRPKTVRSQQQRLACWLIEPASAPAPNRSEPHPPTVLINHANKGNMADALDHAALFSRLGCWVVLYDYQGFGQSAGQADVDTLANDAAAVLEALDTWPEPVRSAGCVVVGLSLGTLVAVALANRMPERVAGLILEGTVDPHAELREKFGPLGAVMAEVVCAQIPDELATSRTIRHVRCPTLFIHAEDDPIATVALSSRLIEAARCPKQVWLAPQGGHLELIRTQPQEYERRVRAFLRTLGHSSAIEASGN